jgi:protein subunit release factor B
VGHHLAESSRTEPCFFYSLINKSKNVSLTFVRCSYSRASGAEAIVDVSIAGESATATTKRQHNVQRMIRKLSHADNKKSHIV